MPWLMCDGRVLAALEVAGSPRDRRRGLRGRDDFQGALLLRPCRQVHTFGVRFPVDVAFCRRDGLVLSTTTMPPRRVSRPFPRAAFAIEAKGGAFSRWKLAPGDRVEMA